MGEFFGEREFEEKIRARQEVDPAQLQNSNYWADRYGLTTKQRILWNYLWKNDNPVLDSDLQATFSSFPLAPVFASLKRKLSQRGDGFKVELSWPRIGDRELQMHYQLIRPENTYKIKQT